ncbi:PHP domain-containing protein [Faecalicatena contorta]|uniref:PHP domain-containing protein n=2 Tax=Faecalicatena contorta TaxID=39482 RepID=UPI00129E1C11|nr:PHP domain-containing protein [Faecalicatena contorta]MEE0201465.1 PHP domain-containing protein [Muricomes sp.]MRM90492.1 PHP domain-containing protein [Faecalicatena contorta]
MYRADLHIHTAVSDCSMKTEAILAGAKAAGITHLSFTDHDTTLDAEKHKEMAEQQGIQSIIGIEMSAFDFKRHKKVHILGYKYQTNRQIEAIGKETLKKRNENCLKQIEILRDLGYRISAEEIRKTAGSCIYKQHILDYLVKTGQSETLFGRVYQNIFKNQGPCDFDIEYPAAEDVVQAIKADKGYAVLAHPGQQGNYGVIHRLAEAGLDGIEWNHPSHGKSDRRRIEEYCRSYRLFMTGGSDFHGRYENGKTMLGAYPAHESSEILFIP